MAGLSAVLPYVPVALQVGSMIMGSRASSLAARGAEQAAEAARRNALNKQKAGEFVAQQLEVNAGQAVAAAQRGAMDERRNARLVQSRALALSAASGGGALDPTIVNNLGRIAGEGTYRANVRLYEGAERARELRMAAAAKRFEGRLGIEGGEATAEAYRIAGETEAMKGTSAMLKGGAGLIAPVKSLLEKYGNGGPSGDAAVLEQADFSDGYY